MYYYSMPKSSMSIIVFYRHIAVCKRVNSPHPHRRQRAVLLIVIMTSESALAKKVGCIWDM